MTTLPLESSSPKQQPFIRHSIQFITQPVVASFVAGGIAGAVSRTVVSPLGQKNFATGTF